MDHRYTKFLSIVEHKSFTTASQQLHVSQPALTAAIQQLERELGTQLIIRHKRQFSLTPAGQAVYAGAVRLRIEYNAMLGRVREQNSNQATIRIGMLDTIATLLIPPLQARLAGRQVEVTVDNSTRLIQDVRVGRLDLAIIVQQEAPLPEGVGYEILPSEQFGFVATPPVATSLSTNVIPNWLAFNPDSTTYTYFTQAFMRSNIQARPIFYSTSMDLLKQLCMQGVGVALLPLQLVDSELTSGTLVTIGEHQWYRRLWLIKQESFETELSKEITGYTQVALSAGSSNSR